MTDQSDKPKKPEEANINESSEQVPKPEEPIAQPTEAEPAPTPSSEPEADDTNVSQVTENVIRTEPAAHYNAYARPTNEPQKKHGTGFIAWLALIIGLAASALAIWLYLQASQQQNQLDAQTQQLLAQQTALNAELKNRQVQFIETTNRAQADTNANIASQLTQFQAQIDQDLNQQKQKVQQTLDQVLSSQVGHTQKAVLVDARYLLTLAGRKLYIEQDKNGTIDILKLAQTRLAQQNNSQWFNLNNQIADDIAKIQSINEVDINAIYFALTEISRQLMNLPFNQAYMPEKTRSTTAEHKPTETISLANLELIWREFLELFIPKRRKGTVEPLLSPGQAQNIRQNLISKLNQAQWAALKKNQPIYLSALNDAADWIKTYYQIDNGKTKALLNQLTGLTEKNLETDFSTVTIQSAEMIESLIKKSNSHAQLTNKVAP